jgi:hypothetical protein
LHFIFEDVDFSITTMKKLIKQGEGDAEKALENKEKRKDIENKMGIVTKLSCNARPNSPTITTLALLRIWISVFTVFELLTKSITASVPYFLYGICLFRIDGDICTALFRGL